MDFNALHQGVVLASTILASVTFSIPADIPASEVPLTNPEIISSYNLTEGRITDNLTEEKIVQPSPNLPEGSSHPESIQNLNTITQPITDQLKMVVKEAQASEIVTVEQPPVVYTVIAPTPKPSAKPAEEEAEESVASPNPSQSPKPEEKKDEKKEVSKSAEPSATPQPAPIALNSSNAETLFQMTNDYRAKMGKPAFEKEDRLCKIAENRAPQVNGELSSGTLHKGFKDLNLPYWATENLAAYASMKENFQFLSTDYIHRKAIESDAKYSCTACLGTSCSQIFSSFISK